MTVGRRRALAVIGGVAAGMTLAPGSAAAAPARGALRLRPRHGRALQVIRVEDMLYLGFRFINAEMVVKNGQTYIAVTDPGLPAYVLVVFPPQHHGEQTLRNTDGVPLPPLFDALAGPSWLTFELPADASIPFTAAGLLAWGGLTPQLVPVVSDPATGVPAPPDLLHSALEVPWSLWLSPPAGGTWHHSAAPVTAGGRTELWHTRLGIGGAEPPAVTPLIKAFWSGTYGSTGQPPADPWPMSLSPETRNDIVNLSCSLVAGGGGGPVQVSLLALSALGASVDMQGAWSPGPDSGVSLAQWTHRASTGRDSYVRVVTLGYLFPFGHRAVQVRVTDREFRVDRQGSTVAYLVTATSIVVTQPVITYTGDPHEPYNGRGNPMRSVEVRTLSTGPVDFDDPLGQVGGVSTDSALWIRSNSVDVPFSFVATDIEGRTVDFTTPAIWVNQNPTGRDGTVANPTDLADTITAAYDAAGAARNTPSLGGALLAFADTSGAVPGSTAHLVDTYTLTANAVSNGAAGFYPLLNAAQVHLPGPEQLTGSPLTPPSISMAQQYLQNGFQNGVTELYAQVAASANATSLSFPANLVGGMAAPNFDVSGIARDLGPVGGDLTDLAAGRFDPSKYFNNGLGDVGNLLGSIPVTAIIQAVGLTPGTGSIAGADQDGPSASAQAPQLTYNLVYPNDDDTQLPVALDAKLTWNPVVAPSTQDPFAGFFVPDENANLLITAEIHAPIANPAHVTYAIHGELTNFELVLFGDATPCIDIKFTSFTFDSKTGAKTSVNPKIESVSFMGALSFIQDLEQLLASLDGPSIDVTAAGIAASYTLALPDVTVGIFSLSNLSLTGAVTIPFDGTPVRVQFGLCSQDDPFLLTIYVFGGGGFFSLSLGADGIEELQVSLEFGAAISINLGVASGSVSIMAGIYFALQTNPNQVTLTGFLRADGNLSVLGIITLSMEFYLGLTYQNPGQAYGEATVTVSISVLFFSKSVSASMRKTFGGGSDPDFAQAISMADWDTYCEAFA
jgi:hypothetical protein